jgi:hypothetical protein
VWFSRWPHERNLLISENAGGLFSVDPYLLKLGEHLPGLHPPLLGQFMDTFPWHITSPLGPQRDAVFKQGGVAFSHFS